MGVSDRQAARPGVDARTAEEEERMKTSSDPFILPSNLQNGTHLRSCSMQGLGMMPAQTRRWLHGVCLLVSLALTLILLTAGFSLYYEVPGHRYWPTSRSAGSILAVASWIAVPSSVVLAAIAMCLRSVACCVVGVINLVLVAAWAVRFLTLLTYL